MRVGFSNASPSQDEMARRVGQHSSSAFRCAKSVELTTTASWLEPVSVALSLLRLGVAVLRFATPAWAAAARDALPEETALSPKTVPINAKDAVFASITLDSGAHRPLASPHEDGDARHERRQRWPTVRRQESCSGSQSTGHDPTALALQTRPLGKTPKRNDSRRVDGAAAD